MDLIEEYFIRRKIDYPLVKYTSERTQLILHPKDKAEFTWLNMTMECHVEQNKPAYYEVVVAGNPVIYATPDFSHFSFHHEKTILSETWEWEQYETKLLDWVKTVSPKYVAITGKEALPVCWKMFLSNYDAWFAGFLSHRLFDDLHKSLIQKDNKSISLIEEWLKNTHEKVWYAWRSIKKQLENRIYADWLVTLVNSQ